MSTVEQTAVQEIGGHASAPQAGGTLAAIRRLQAFDGLFLRAEHLNAITDYATALATAIGSAGGAGVVEGYGLYLSAGELRAAPGLAIDPSGWPLVSRQQISVRLDELQPAADTYWYVEAVRDGAASGNEPVQGLLCDDPCGGGTTRSPYYDETVAIRLTAAVDPELAGWSYEQKRSRLTSRLFAEEQSKAGAWSRIPGDPASGFATRSWLPPDLPPGRDDAVRLGLLIPDADLQRWQLDVWGARRDRGASPPTRLWQWRLGMRPWDVFVAQLLQFQDMLGYTSGPSLVQTLVAHLDTIVGTLREETKAQSVTRLTALRSSLATGEPVMAAPLEETPTELLQRGILELPPAGFLPYSGGLPEAAREMGARFGDGVRVRICTCRPVDLALAVQNAQHRDRIPLDRPDQPADVDVLIPVTADGDRPVFDWVAFVRREEVSCGEAAAKEPVDEVDVWMLSVGEDREALTAALRQLHDGDIPGDARKAGTLDYPARGWAVPSDPEYAAIYAAVETELRQSQVLAFGVVREEGRRPLGALRAERLAVTFKDDDEEALPEVYTAAKEGVREAIVLVFHQVAEEKPPGDGGGGDQGPGDGQGPVG
jgi:hypothetical protein